MAHLANSTIDIMYWPGDLAILRDPIAFQGCCKRWRLHLSGSKVSKQNIPLLCRSAIFSKHRGQHAQEFGFDVPWYEEIGDPSDSHSAEHIHDHLTIWPSMVCTRWCCKCSPRIQKDYQITNDYHTCGLCRYTLVKCFPAEECVRVAFLRFKVVRGGPLKRWKNAQITAVDETSGD